MLSHLITTLSSQLLPQSCFLCGDLSAQAICNRCARDLPYLIEPVQSSHVLHSVDDATALFDYTYPVNKLIQAAKFNHHLALLHFLGSLMATHLDFEQHPDVIIPVPLHTRRLRERGYNQSLELAKPIHKQLGIALNYTACQRIRYTTPQVGLDGKARLHNLHRAFAINNPPHNWKHVLLIDDVLTTGSTVEAVSNTLKQAGIERVTVWCCALRLESSLD